MADDILVHHGVKGQKWGVRKKNTFNRTNIKQKNVEFEKKRHVARAKASIKTGTKFLASNAPMLAGAAITVVLTGSIAPLASTAVTTSMNTIGKAAEAAAIADKKIIEERKK